MNKYPIYVSVAVLAISIGFSLFVSSAAFTRPCLEQRLGEGPLLHNNENTGGSRFPSCLPPVREYLHQRVGTPPAGAGTDIVRCVHRPRLGSRPRSTVCSAVNKTGKEGNRMNKYPIYVSVAVLAISIGFSLFVSSAAFTGHV